MPQGQSTPASVLPPGFDHRDSFTTSITFSEDFFSLTGIFHKNG